LNIFGWDVSRHDEAAISRRADAPTPSFLRATIFSFRPDGTPPLPAVPRFSAR